MAIEVGTRAGKYELVQQLGAGGVGLVFLARDHELGRDCALKFLLPEHTGNAEHVQRFLQEARAAARIHQDTTPMCSKTGNASSRRMRKASSTSPRAWRMTAMFPIVTAFDRTSPRRGMSGALAPVLFEIGEFGPELAPAPEGGEHRNRPWQEYTTSATVAS